MSASPEPGYSRAHRHCTRNRAELERSEPCGCFYCVHIFPPSEIHTFISELDSGGKGVTALCPRFPVDAVIGSASGFHHDRVLAADARSLVQVT